jgi:GH25 family lysozyme M1 (1,4-beta-N-acetylmuramidase)
VQGIDISKWNGTMNFQVTKTKCQFVIIRAGYGLQWKDPMFDANVAGCRAADMPFGLYWYCYNNQDPEDTADSFADLIVSSSPQLEAHGDLEQTYLGQQQTLDWFNAFEGRLQGRTGKLQVSYSSAGFWNPNVARSAKWRNRRDWAANWTTRDYPTVPIDWTWQQGDYWQHSADGNRKGAEYGSVGGDADMDLNRWYGTVIQFNTTYGTHITYIGAPPQPPGQVPESVIINTGELAIHNTPQAIQGNVVGHALFNKVWHPYEEVYQNGIYWYRVTKDGYISKNYTRLP